MIFTNLTRKALEIATKAHEGQVDKAGVTYILHPVHLAEQMDTPIETAVALLHDVVEDSDYTLKDLIDADFPYQVIEAVDLLTHKDGVPYMEYIAKIKDSGNPVARKVKLADLRHNSDFHRLGSVDDDAKERREKYQQAIDFLEQDFYLDYEMKDADFANFRKLQNRTYRDKIRGCMIGSAVGDALGYPIEFMRWNSIRSQYGDNGITEYTRENGVVQISDDTQMAMFTAVGLLRADTAFLTQDSFEVPIYYIHEAYLDWLKTQEDTVPGACTSWICKDPALFHCRAPGNTCLSALESSEIGNIIVPINNSKGCGGIMRVHPVALAAGTEKTVRSVDSFAVDVAAVTHGHALGWLPAAVFAHIVYRIVFGGCKYGDHPMGIVHECKETLYELYLDSPDLRTLFSCIDKAAALSQNDTADVDNIKALGEGWVAEEALAIALYCWLRYPTDFDKAIIASVNHSGDSDSTGAIAGAILGATVGYDAISDKWKTDLELHDVLLELADDLCDGCQMSESLDYVDEEWLKKYGTDIPEKGNDEDDES